MLRTYFLIYFGVEILIYIFYYGIFNYPYYLAIYFTEWGYLLTFLLVISTTFPKKKNKKTEKEAIFLHVCLTGEFLITVFFWLVLYKDIEHDSLIDHIICISRHIMPIVYLILEYYFTEVLLGYSSIKYFVILMVGYFLNNYILTIYLEVKIYPVLNWKDT